VEHGRDGRCQNDILRHSNIIVAKKKTPPRLAREGGVAVHARQKLIARSA
jgi:hypothetical protein